MSETEKTSLSRRALLQTAAWTVPAVAVAAAAPMASASGEEPPIDPSYTPGTFCKHPGNPKYYHAVFCFKNTTAEDITITLGSMVVNGIARQANFSHNDTATPTYTIPANTELCLYVDAGLYDDSANGEATVFFTYPYGGMTNEGQVSTSGTNNLPPCSNIGQPTDTPPHSPDGPSAP